MYKLEGTDGSKFYTWPLQNGIFKIGRSDDCDFCILNKTVSRVHARIHIDNDGNKIILEDLGSHNGTFINGLKLINSAELKENDALLFGKAEFKISKYDISTGPMPKYARAVLADQDPQRSIFMSMDETMRPLPQKITEIPELLPTLFDMAKMLNLIDPEEVILDKSLDMISKIIPAERLVVLFVSDDQQEVYTAARKIKGQEDSDGIELSQTIVNAIITNKQSILISDPKSDPRFSAQESIIASSIKSAMAVPLFDQDKVLGILYVDSTNPMHRYNDEYLRVLATFGNIIGSRLLNYSLLAERQAKQVMDAELNRASQIQKDLLVEKPPEIPGFNICAFQEQSRSVGGDLYDLKLLPDGDMIFMVADVSGKGMGAALLMSNILASFRILYEHNADDLAGMVKEVSLQLCNYASSSNFATLFIGKLNPQTGKIKYVNGGHNPPLIVHQDGKLELIDATGMMIGAFDFVEWEQKELELKTGETMFMFTDGVTEADRDGQGDQFGDDKLEKLVSSNAAKNAEELTDIIMDEINTFMGKAPRSDDITMMTIKRNKS